MTRTSTIISFGRNAFEIRDDVSSTSIVNGGLQSFGNINSLFTDDVSSPYATFEPNFWLLDGNYKIAPSSNAKGGWVSTAMSPSTGDFSFAAPEPELQINFNTVHSTNGLYISFSPESGDYIDRFRITFYSASLVTIREDTYFPTGTTFFTNQPIANFKRIQIKIYSTNRASRYARISRIDFDEMTRFTGDTVKQASLTESIDPLSIELPSNVVEFELYSASGDFSIIAPQGIYATLQYKEPLDIHGIIENETVYLGRFYLDDWKSSSSNNATFKASDAINLLDLDNFLGGLWVDENADGMIGYAISSANPSMGNTPTGIPYSINPSLLSVRVDGFLENMSRRKALQYILFAIGAYATCSRSNVIEINPLEIISQSSSYDYLLTNSQKGISSPIELRQLVTGVELTSHDFSEDSSVTGEILINQNLAIGSYVIVFELFAFNYDNTGTTAVLSQEIFNQNHAVITVSTAGLLKWTRVGAIRDTKKVLGIYTNSLPKNIPQNILRIMDVTLVSSLVIQTITQRIYDYCQQRYVVKTKLLANASLKIGDSVLIDIQGGKQIKGIVEKMNTNLTGGFISDVEIVGVIA